MSTTSDPIKRRVNSYRMRDGRVLQVTQSPVEGGGFVAIHEDITTDVQRLDALKASSDEIATQKLRFEAALANMPHGLSLYDAERRLAICNERYRRRAQSTDDAKHGCSGPNLGRRPASAFARTVGVAEIAVIEPEMIWASGRHPCLGKLDPAIEPLFHLRLSLPLELWRVDLMSEFDQAVQHERLRLTGLISEAKDKMAELLTQVAADELRIEALDAYDGVKVGKALGGKGPKKALRRPRSATLTDANAEPAED